MNDAERFYFRLTQHQVKCRAITDDAAIGILERLGFFGRDARDIVYLWPRG